MAPSKYRRRTVLRLGGSVSLSLIAGCASVDAPRDTTASSPPTERTTDATASPSRTPTRTRRTTHGPPLERYELGQWYDGGDLQYTVTSIDLRETFELDCVDDTYEMPSDTELAIADAKVRNTTTEPGGLSAPLFAVFAGSKRYYSRSEFDHPSFDSPLDVSALLRVGKTHRWAPEAHTVDPGTTLPFWVVAVVPRTASKAGVEVGYDDGSDSGFPIRWVAP